MYSSILLDSFKCLGWRPHFICTVNCLGHLAYGDSWERRSRQWGRLSFCHSQVGRISNDAWKWIILEILVCPLCLHSFRSCPPVCYIETSPFLIRTSRAILHVSQIPQKKVIRASLIIVPCGWKIATTWKQGRQTFHTEICSSCGFLIAQFKGEPKISKINQFHMCQIIKKN